MTQADSRNTTPPPGENAFQMAGDRRLAALYEGQNQVLEMLVAGSPLQQLLQKITLIAESQSTEGMLASILLLSEDGRHLIHGAAPSLPAEYNTAIDGLAIGENVGSCGTAVFLDSEVIATNIDTDPRWANFRSLALRHGFCSCWSTPISSGAGKVLGTFALYYPRPHHPQEFERQMVSMLSRTAAIVIEWHHQQRHKKITEKVLTESRQRFENLVRDASVGIVVVQGLDLRIILCNDAYAKLIGRPTSELTGRPIFDVVPESENAFRPIIEKVLLTGGQIYVYEKPYAVSSGSSTIRGFLNLVYQRYRDVPGNPDGVMILCQDVTAQVLSRLKMEQAEETARLAVEAAELGTFHVNLQTNELTGSQRLYEIFGVPPGEGRDGLINVMHPDDLIVRARAYELAVATSQLEYEVRVKRSKGFRWIRTKGRIFYSDGRKPSTLLGVVQDITEEKEFADELTRLVKERTSDLEQFVYVSHHDLQEPLRKISMFSEILITSRELKLPEQSASKLLKINAAAKRMSVALRDVLNLASLSNSEGPSPVDLNKLVGNALADMELTISEKQAIVRVADLPQIIGNAGQLSQLFYNLLNNALKFILPGRRPDISISASILTDQSILKYHELDPGIPYLHIVISDNGIGFNQSAAEKIFILFYRLHSREKFTGTGIGLALCKKVVANHKGSIWAESIEGTGTSFHVLLPALATAV